MLFLAQEYRYIDERAWLAGQPGEHVHSQAFVQHVRAELQTQRKYLPAAAMAVNTANAK